MTKHQQILSKIKSLDEAKTWMDSLKDKGQKVVFTNGCFDILHLGHVTYLAKAADCGDKLIVGVNSDSSVKRQNKGDDRPINPEQARLQVIASLGFVDAVICFDGDTPLPEIEKLRPSVLVKGADYDPNETDTSSKKYIVGREAVLEHGGSVQTIALVEGFSTTAILAKGKK